MKKTVAILGEGAWGTALATLFAHNGHAVRLWCYHADVVQQIISTRINQRFMPNLLLDASITPTAEMHEALSGADIIVEAIPVVYLRTTFQKTIGLYKPDAMWVITSKGIEQDTLLLPSQILFEVCGEQKPLILAGPSFAHEVVKKQTTCFCVATHDTNQDAIAKELFCSSFSSIEITSDYIGVQVCAAFKNCIAIALGILHGSGQGENARAACVTKLILEMVCLVQAMGGNKETVYGLSGIGDTVLTALSMKSRNSLLGVHLGSGLSCAEALRQISGVCEGSNTLQSIAALCKQYAVTVPLCLILYRVVVDGEPIQTLINAIIE